VREEAIEDRGRGGSEFTWSAFSRAIPSKTAGMSGCI
jgi:hypothetical protein